MKLLKQICKKRKADWRCIYCGCDVKYLAPGHAVRVDETRVAHVLCIEERDDTN